MPCALTYRIGSSVPQHGPSIDNQCMSATWGWALALLAVALGWVQWGWQGVLLAVSVIVFWLLLQFSRALRVMRQAAGAPVGHVPSAVMLHAKLRSGMRLMDIIPLTRSLGQAVVAEAGSSETFIWTDASGAVVRVELVAGRVHKWALERPVSAVDLDQAGSTGLADKASAEKGLGA